MASVGSREALTETIMIKRRAQKFDPLTEEEKDAVLLYAAGHGRSWKTDLGNQWMRGSSGPVLHRLRNTHGPSWLHSLKIESLT